MIILRNILVFFILSLLFTPSGAQGFNLYTRDITSDGDTIWNQVDEFGKKQGYWKKEYDNGKLRYKGYFKNDQPMGTLKRFYNNGKLKAKLTYSDDSPETWAEIYYSNGNLAARGKYYKMEKDSIWKYFSYYSGNLTSEEAYLKGKKNGKFKYYYDNKSICQVINWKNGLKDGEWIQYFENGKKKMHTQYVDGQRHGKLIFYYPNGMIELTGFYHADVRIGTWHFFNEEGQKKLEIVYKDGRPLNEKELTEMEQEFFKELEKNIGNIKEPSESIFPQ